VRIKTRAPVKKSARFEAVHYPLDVLLVDHTNQAKQRVVVIIDRN